MSLNALAMHHVDRQPPVHGFVNTSTTAIDRSGIFDATVKSFDNVINFLKSQPVRYVTETDNLSPERLANLVCRQLVSHPELAEPSATLSVLQQKTQLIRELRGRRPTKLLRDVETITANIVEPVVVHVREAVEAAFGSAPFRGVEIIEAVRSTLAGLTLTEPDAEPLNRLGRLTRALHDLTQRSIGIPRKSIEFAEQRLTERALPEYDSSIAALATEFVSERLRIELKGLNDFCDECLLRVTKCLHNIARIQAAVIAARTESAKAGHVSKSSVVLGLPGPSADDVIAGLRSRLRCADANELSSALCTQFVATLRPLAERWISDTAPVGVLLTHVDAEQAAAEFVVLIETLLGEGHSLYEIIDRFGVLRVATELVNRSEQLGSLQSRDLEVFHITPLTMTIVRLPQPVGPRDLQIRDQLEAAFLTLTRNNCLRLSCSPAERNAITVVRMKTGFPIGIEGGNEALLLEYVKASHAGHLPHLVGVISASDHGEAIPTYVELGRRLGPDHSTNALDSD